MHSGKYFSKIHLLLKRKVLEHVQETRKNLKDFLSQQKEKKRVFSQIRKFSR